MKLKIKKPTIFKKLRTKLKKLWGKIGTLNIVLIIVGVFFLWFNYRMIQMFELMGSIPESYACAVIAAVLGECGVCGWIRTTKDKQRDRKWSKEDEAEIHDRIDANMEDTKGE